MKIKNIKNIILSISFLLLSINSEASGFSIMSIFSSEIISYDKNSINETYSCAVKPRLISTLGAQKNQSKKSIAKYLKPPSIQDAVCKGDLDLVKTLLVEGTDINERDKKGNTLLKKAISCKQEKVVTFLLENKADVNIPNNSGRTLLFDSAHKNNTDLLKKLLKYNADPNIGDKSGMFPLHKAVLNENLESVKGLIAANANINELSNRGNTALEIAIREGYDEVAEFLEQHGGINDEAKPQMDEMYLDDDIPGIIPKIFAYNFISTENKTQNAVFNPDGKEYYYTVETINNPGIIRMSKFEEGKWTRPVPAAIPGEFREVDPFITSDGCKLFFCWDKPVEENDGRIRNMDIWMMNREGETWSEPIHLGKDINTDEHDWFPTVSKKGTLYYSTGKYPESNIYYSEFKEGTYQKPLLVGGDINTAHRDFAPFIAPDESYMIFSSTRPGGVGNSDLYISFKNEKGIWGEAINMRNINSSKADFGPSISLDGNYLFFTSWREGSASDVYWVDTRVIEDLKTSKNK